MRAAVYKNKGVLEIAEISAPVPGPGEVVIRVLYCGICGSDVRLASEGFFSPGLVIGHEFCGTIHEVGDGVEGWARGDRITVMPASTCGACPCCVRGERHHCVNIKIMGVNQDMPGGFAEYVKVGASMLHRLPQEVTDEEAANVEPCAVSLRAVKGSALTVGNSVVIFGAGSIGLFALQLARLAGAGAVYVVEPAPGRAHAACVLGADEVFDPGKTRVSREVTGLTGEGADVAFVCSDDPVVLQQAAESVRCQGEVTLVAGGLSAKVNTEYWMWREVKIRGSFAYTDEFALALQLFRQGKVHVEGMISDVIPLDGLQQAMVGLRQPTSQVKVLVQPN